MMTGATMLTQNGRIGGAPASAHSSSHMWRCTADQPVPQFLRKMGCDESPDGVAKGQLVCRVVQIHPVSLARKSMTVSFDYSRIPRHPIPSFPRERAAAALGAAGRTHAAVLSTSFALCAQGISLLPINIGHPAGFSTEWQATCRPRKTIRNRRFFQRQPN